jgi:hypothetical protein
MRTAFRSGGSVTNRTAQGVTSDKLWVCWTLFGPCGLALRVVWFHDILWDDGPVTFRSDAEADLYILLVLENLRDELKHRD